MSRSIRLYKRLLDITLFVSYGLMLLLVFALLFGVIIQAYDFGDVTTPMIKPEHAYLGSILISLVAAIVIFVVAARVFLSFIENTEKLESATDYRKKLDKTSERKTKKVAFSQTDTYKKIREKGSRNTKLGMEKLETSSEVVEEQLSFAEEIKPEMKMVEDIILEKRENEVVETKREEIIISETQIEEKTKEVIEENSLDNIVNEVESEVVEEVEIKNKSTLVTTEIGPKTTTKKFYTRLNKSEITKIVQTVVGISNYKSKKFMKALLDIIQEELVAGNEVKIDDFGKFVSKVVKEKQARNPRTGEKLTVPEHNAVKFIAFKQFKDDITNDVTDTSMRYLLTKPIKYDLSEDEVQNELIKEEKIREHIDINVIQKEIKKAAPKPKKKAVPKKTKSDIIEYISINTDLSKNKANKFLKHFSEVILESLIDKQDVKLTDFGTFTTIHIPAKDAINPSNQEKMVVPDHNQVRLRFDKTFKDIFNVK